MNAVVYLFQVSACMGIFYLFYYLLLSRYTFFTINRWYLIVTLAIMLCYTVAHHNGAAAGCLSAGYTSRWCISTKCKHRSRL
jgi:hypothetical protein